jgi:tRNA nucleotidyltransferase (CCA-adding enzyme)
MATDPAALSLATGIARAVRSRGGRALVVGGWVRDRLLGLPSKDVDLEVFGVPASDLRALLDDFGRVETVGESFTVYKIGDLDVSLPRRESKVGRGHRAFAVEGDPSMSFDEAARRRDFTINAIGWDLLDHEYVDPFHGGDDLERRVLRVVDASRFAEDSLRVLRAVQFTARFELTIAPATRDLCRAIPLDDLPAERVWGEVEKLLLLPARPSLGLAAALDLGVVERLFPEMAALVGCDQEPAWHPEGDVWVHTLLVVDEAHARIHDLPRHAQLAVMLGAVCHDLGKPATTAFQDGRIRSLGHEEAGVAPALALLDRLNVHSIDGYDVRAQVVGLTAHHLKPGAWHKVRDQVGDGAFRRLAQKVDLELLARVAAADCRGRPGDFDCSAMEWFLERARALGVEHGPPKPLVLGRHLIALGVRPGPRMGEVLRAVYERQLDGAIGSVEEGVAAAREMLANEERRTENGETEDGKTTPGRQGTPRSVS